MFYIFLGFGLLIRLLLIPIPGFKADVAFWKGWGLAVADKGILWLVNNTNYNYPPGFAYILWLINKVYALFKNPYNINEYWADNNVLYLFLIKIITIIADLVVVLVIIKIGRKIREAGKQKSDVTEIRKSEHQKYQSSVVNLPTSDLSLKLIQIFALFYFLNPAVIYDGTVWGQVDQLGLALLLVSSYLLLVNRPRWAAVALIVGCLMKFQNIIFLPLFFLFIFKKFSFREMISSFAIALLTFMIIVSPFIFSRQMEKLYWLLTINSDWFPWFSLNSFNFWWIASGLKGMQMNDKHLFIGIISAKQFGLYMFIFAYFISSITVFLSKKEELFKNFVLACSLAVFAFFHLLTQSHERYLFPLTGLLPILFLFYFNQNYISKIGSISNFQFLISKQISNFKFQINWILVIGYLIFSIFFFLNMYLSMGWNYPDQVIPRFTREETLGLSWWISIAQIILFGVFVWWYFRMGLIRHMRLIGLMGLLITGVLLLKNTNYLFGKPIFLTSLKPVGWRQDYLEPVYNKTVESARGVKYWNSLSVNYFYYDSGIGSHADSEITYHLGRKFSKFSTDFGIDTESDQNAKVYFSMIGDGKELFKSGVKGRFDKPRTISVDVAGVNYLALKITKAGETNFGAHADWLNPKLIK
ncbi:hypothetical protein A2954_00070 [Candidatus Roizmanbacteria bacterium RIFCSPLOWO2_01_FULL_37_12]|uniref:Glycosyl hydrolase family 98 putative carbohydrate-binding module domain-containing protein n=1 Tax=Candidatus Roizmanbacteria bacterium RIFCSPLOWO2_01_FULL_37_12 TaxID=1802056 RepID=A0A1F7IBE6_9BACT|nr:MAG: hypothetical protein A3D76_00395 [Candidatus Roizmanbacteria bacterium RIFCSPHIGHO2_02_FULL_37_9b]OGK40679.1 MAG: hypothetical protein A2954_00070 [Candidatus Roizmanbacteria bacterium RIFCSPLOWO2_01_FULL_37_12]